jgi:hypothetical protein
MALDMHFFAFRGAELGTMLGVTVGNGVVLEGEE